METYRSTRYAPMNRSHILGFPNRFPRIDWQTHFPKFKDEKRDDVSLHLVKFHVHTHKLRVELHEYFLIKMFMATLEGKENSWYETLPSTGIYSLKHFYKTFFLNYKKHHTSIALVKKFY